MTTRDKRRRLAVVGLVVGILLAASCSDDDDAAVDTSTAGSSPSATAAPVETSPGDAATTAAPAAPTTAVDTTDVATTTPATDAPSTSAAPPAPTGFAVPADRRQELETAGLEWMLDVDYPAQPAGVPWPTTAWPTGPLPAGIDPAAVQAIVDQAFQPATDDAGNDLGKVDAIVAVSGGQLVVEAYNGWVPEEPHVSWSMAKSITQALIGVLVAEDRLDPFAPAPVPEWTDPADPRHDITLDALLHMRSGLQWQEEYAGESDVITLLYGDGRADRGHFAASKPLAETPDTTFNYSTGTAMILSRIIADQVGYGEAGTAWAQSVLFDPLGITTVAHDLDGIGTMSGGSSINMSAQDFARFGLLYLRGGEWDGQQILPREWIDYARLPRADTPVYGAQWWVDDTNRERVVFYADGFAGQFIVIVPSLDLVVVTLSNAQGDQPGTAAWGLIDAFATAS